MFIVLFLMRAMSPAIKSTVVMFLAGATLPLLAFADETQNDQPVTVVTLYSTTVPVLGEGSLGRPVVTQPIQVVAGGVKSTPGSCFDIAANGDVNPAAGECVVLESGVKRQ
jgi:hypothetical protein